MSRTFLLVVPMLVIASLGFPFPVKAIDPVVAYTGSILLKKLLVEPAWDAVTGKPNVKLIDQRLRELEKNAAMRTEVREELRKLRESINDRVTRDEFRIMADRTLAAIDSIRKRLDDVEERVEKLEVENEDLRNGTAHAKEAGFFIQRGEKYQVKKSFYNAIACYNIAMRLEPPDALLYLNRCSCYIDLGAPEVGILDASEAIRLNPTSVIAYGYRGLGRSSERDYEAAIADFSEAKRLNPSYSNQSCNHAFAVALTERNNPHLSVKNNSDDKKLYPPAEKALADLTKAIRLDPNYGEAYYRRGTEYLREKEYSNAIWDLDAAIRIDPNHASAYLQRGWARVQSKSDYEKAIEDFTRAILLDPKDRGDWFGRDVYLGRMIAYKYNGDDVRSKADDEETRRIVRELRREGK